MDLIACPNGLIASIPILLLILYEIHRCTSVAALKSTSSSVPFPSKIVHYR